MPPLSGLLVLYEGTEYQISDIFVKIRGFAVNWCHAVLVQICNEILLAWENYADTVSVVVGFINCDNRLKASLRKNAFLLIFRDISNVSTMAED